MRVPKAVDHAVLAVGPVDHRPRCVTYDEAQRLVRERKVLGGPAASAAAVRIVGERRRIIEQVVDGLRKVRREGLVR